MRQQQSQSGARREGIDVGRHFQPLLTSVRDRIQDLADLADVRLALDPDMGDHDRQLRLAPDFETLFERLENVVAVVAHVGAEDASVGGRDLREFDDLVVASVVSGGVRESDREPESTSFHRLSDGRFHASKLALGGRTVVESHRVDADRSMPDHGHEVGGNIETIQLAQILVEGAPAPGEYAFHR